MFNQGKFLFIIISGILVGTVSYGLQQSLKYFNEAVGDPEPVRFATIKKISPLKYNFEVLGSVFEINIDKDLARKVKSYSFK
ncbi:MAG: hypothetical protein XD78_0212 [Desulfotomaculum sp. 46_296]|nr:MAG: hypothetical protein XD78_0212 [Desulfotomaculum sp. 46_296]KUK84513.1 MAG: hypothetical protein XE00_0674 [Desulfofundulus kuznetsovii]HAU31033.1 hypothetical protein [Desulfotomaculum sp.]